VDPVVPAGLEWPQALGDYLRLPEWIGYFTQAIDDDGWPAVVATWVPRLMPALRTALFHGAIRTAHAVRAVDAVDTPPRRGELARAGVTGRRATAPGSRPARCPPPVTCGWRSSGPRPTAPAATWPSPTFSTCTGSPARWPSRSSPPTSRPPTAPPRWPTCSPSTPRCTRPPTR